MKFNIIKFFLGSIGLIFFIIFLFSLYSLLETLYFSNEDISENLFKSNSECESFNSKLEDQLCLEIATSYWMMVILIASSVLSFITLFPFFIMKKKDKSKIN